MPNISWLSLLVAIAGVVGGWCAAAWFYGRKIEAIRLQSRVLRQTTAEHLAQMKRQIAQLQAEMAARPVVARKKAAAPAPEPEAPMAQSRREAAENLLDADKAPAHGFAITEVMEDRPKDDA